jgi:sugar phosphate isomerase/epimerase
MFKLSAMADEISEDFDEQLVILATLGFRHIEFRSVRGKNVDDFRVREVKPFRKKLNDAGVTVTALATASGKAKISDDFGEEMKIFERLQDMAETLGTKCLRIFSYYPDELGNILNRREEVLERLSAKVERATARGQILLLENAKRTFGDKPHRCADLLATIHSPHFRATFDFANYVEFGVKPFEDAYPLLRDWISCCHVKDAVLREGTIIMTPAGEGDGQIAEVLRDLATREDEIVLTVSPRLVASGPTRGWSGPQLFQKATQSLRNLLEQIGAKTE